MTSLFPITQSFYLQDNIDVTIKQYHNSRIMYFLYTSSPLMAFIAQRAGLDDWLDSEMFKGTIFIPDQTYCKLYLSYFQKHLDRLTARRIIESAVVDAVVTTDQLAQYDWIPTHSRYNRIHVQAEPLLLNDVCMVRPNLLFENGLVHIVNGLISPLDRVSVRGTCAITDHA